MILPREGEPVVVQNITGRYGALHTKLMREYGTNIAAGAAPKRGGMTVDTVPVFNNIGDAVRGTGAKTSVFFVPAEFALPAAKEAILAGVKLLVVITEHIPVRDTLEILELARQNSASVVGPNCPGLIIPSRKVKLGIMPANSFTPGGVALFSRSGTLTYEIANQLSLAGLGQSVAIGIGGDPVTGLTPTDAMDFVQQMPETKAVVMVGEIGGDAEERLAGHIQKSGYKKPIVAYVAGRFAPKEKKMGHAGAIIYGNVGTADSKITALKAAGVRVAMTPTEVPRLVKEAIG
jgi:succinyl-CoA synthetase alpha subunit